MARKGRIYSREKTDDGKVATSRAERTVKQSMVMFLGNRIPKPRRRKQKQ